MEPESTVEAELHRLRVEVAELRAALIERSELSRRCASERVLYTLAAIEHHEGVALMAVSDLIADEGTELISDDEPRHGVDQMMRVACRVAVS